MILHFSGQEKRKPHKETFLKTAMIFLLTCMKIFVFRDSDKLSVQFPVCNKDIPGIIDPFAVSGSADGNKVVKIPVFFPVKFLIFVNVQD